MRSLTTIVATCLVLIGCNPHQATVEADSATFLRLEKRAFKAHAKGDGGFFSDILSDNIVMTSGGHRISKTDVIRRVSSGKCDLKEGWSFTEPALRKLDEGVFLFTYIGRAEGTCTYNGNTHRQPSPFRSATLWVRSGSGKWQAAFHSENPVVDPAALSVSVQSPTPAVPANDALTNALLAMENSIWDAWRAKDAKRIAELTAEELSFVNIFGTYYATRADVIHDWTGPLCKVQSFSLTNAIGSSVTPQVSILTVTGSIDGSCGGQKPPPIYGATIYVKTGGAWKWAFGFNSPD